MRKALHPVAVAASILGTVEGGSAALVTVEFLAWGHWWELVLGAASEEWEAVSWVEDGQAGSCNDNGTVGHMISIDR